MCFTASDFESHNSCRMRVGIMSTIPVAEKDATAADNSRARALICTNINRCCGGYKAFVASCALSRAMCNDRRNRMGTGVRI